MDIEKELKELQTRWNPFMLQIKEKIMQWSEGSDPSSPQNDTVPTKKVLPKSTEDRQEISCEGITRRDWQRSLESLKTLHQSGIMTREEYHKKREKMEAYFKNLR